jgi:hypothetical protein
MVLDKKEVCDSFRIHLPWLSNILGSFKVSCHFLFLVRFAVKVTSIVVCLDVFVFFVGPVVFDAYDEGVIIILTTALDKVWKINVTVGML